MKKRPIFFEFLLGGSATCTAVLFTNPIEVCKTRLQLQGELMKEGQRVYRGFGHTFVTIIRNEGLVAIQKGLLPGMAYQAMMNGTRLGAYEPVKRLLGAHPEDRFFFPKNILAGATTGAFGALMGSPFFLIKTRLQAQSTALKIGHQHEIKGMLDGLIKQYRAEGLLGLYRGVNGAMTRVAVGSAAQLSTYDMAKTMVLRTGYFGDNIWAHLTASMVAGVAVVLAMNPFDVASTRLYNQPVKDGRGVLYSGPFDCLVKTVRIEGFRGLYKGLWAHYLRLGPHTVLTFVFWEQFKRLADGLNIY